MKNIVLPFIMILSLAAIPASAETEIKTEKQKLSYALGIYFSQGITKHDADIDVPAFLQAIEDVLNKNEPKMSQDEIQAVLQQYQQKLQNERTAKADANRTASEKFLAENKQKDDVVELPSGLQYKVIKEGNGKQPDSDSTVKVHYQGTLINGEVFDSSYERGEPVSLPLNRVIKGWQEALPLMKAGAKWRLYVPPKLAYGERGAGNAIGPNEALIFDIELLEVN